MRQLFTPFSAYCSTATSFELRYLTMHFSTFTYQVYGAQLPVFSSKFGNNCTERNIT